jgi:hypothetical protein
MIEKSEDHPSSASRADVERTYAYRGFEVTVAVVRGIKLQSFVALVAALDQQSGRTLLVQQISGEPGRPFFSAGVALMAGLSAAQWAVDDALAQLPSQPE